ncbi:hypothetical protein CAPTEDRAFT_198004, partial [Capitella teleta]
VITFDGGEFNYMAGEFNALHALSILVKMATYRSRKRVMDLRPRTKEQQGLYLNEDLTRKRESILYSARCLKRERKIQGAWSADGNILIRDEHGKIRKINTQEELDTLK